jgi:uncharacterized membrane protein YkvA (DUF1232 family)
MLQAWKNRVHQLKTELYALYLAYRDPRVPWYGRLWAAVVVAYAFSPIDLIPDPIPVLGYVDDLILIPLGILIALRMIPADVMAESRVQAGERMANGVPVNWIGAALVLLLWIALAAMVVRWLWGEI